MAEELIGNILVAQSGGPTAVINASLAGAITEALNHGCIEEIYGGLNGVLGILREDLVDLAEESQQVIRGLRYTPASALGTCRHKLKRDAEYERVLEVFQAHNIRYFCYIGGNDSMDTANRIAELAASRGYELRVVGIPKTIDNDLVATDHCPGYGSVIKHIAKTVKEMCLDHEGMGQHDLVSILEVMGRSAGWIAAGATLAKGRNRPEDPPHLIYLPEVPFSEEQFVFQVGEVLKKHPYCMIVVGEGLVDTDGNYLNTEGGTDAFGHSQLGGVGQYLQRIVQDRLGIKARSATLGISQRAAGTCASKADNDEAFMCGQAAVREAVSGTSGKMVTLLRGETDLYTCETGLADLSEVANGVKPLPTNWINDDGVSLNFQFTKYALPLIQGEVEVPFENGVPKFIQLARIRVQRKLGDFQVG
ncbi:MAG: 6-phosphofructokinase [Opitutales bacterium]